MAKIHRKVHALVVGHGDVHGLGAIAALLEFQGPGAALDGTVEVAYGVGAHCRAQGVVVEHGDRHALNGLSRHGVLHDAVHAVEALLYQGQHAVVVVVPEVRQLRGRRGFGGRALNGHLTALAVVVHVVLAATRDGVPCVAVNDAVGARARHIA